MTGSKLREKLINEMSDYDLNDAQKDVFEKMMLKADASDWFEEDARLGSRDSMDSFFNDFMDKGVNFWKLKGGGK